MQTRLQLKKNLTTVLLFQLLQFDYKFLRNNNLFYNLLQFLTFVLYFHYLHRIYIEVGPLGKLTETYFFLLKTTQIWVITICVVLDQNGGNVMRYSSSQNSQFEKLKLKLIFYELVANLQSMFPSQEVSPNLSIFITN
jgi:hypothetical protein